MINRIRWKVYCTEIKAQSEIVRNFFTSRTSLQSAKHQNIWSDLMVQGSSKQPTSTVHPTRVWPDFFEQLLKYVFGIFRISKRENSEMEFVIIIYLLSLPVICSLVFHDRSIKVSIIYCQLLLWLLLRNIVDYTTVQAFYHTINYI